MPEIKTLLDSAAISGREKTVLKSVRLAVVVSWETSTVNHLSSLSTIPH